MASKKVIETISSLTKKYGLTAKWKTGHYYLYKDGSLVSKIKLDNTNYSGNTKYAATLEAQVRHNIAKAHPLTLKS